MSNPRCSTYLNDHLAGSTFALDLLEHLQSEHKGTELGRLAAELHAETFTDRLALETLMKQLRIEISSARQAGAWIMEKLSRLKLRWDDPADGNLRLLEALDALSIGIEGKRLLWQALTAAAVVPPTNTTYEQLVQRAERQRRWVEIVRLEAARAVFSDSTGSSPPP